MPNVENDKYKNNSALSGLYDLVRSNLLILSLDSLHTQKGRASQRMATILQGEETLLRKVRKAQKEAAQRQWSEASLIQLEDSLKHGSPNRTAEPIFNPQAEEFTTWRFLRNALLWAYNKRNPVAFLTRINPWSLVPATDILFWMIWKLAKRDFLSAQKCSHHNVGIGQLFSTLKSPSSIS